VKLLIFILIFLSLKITTKKKKDLIILYKQSPYSIFIDRDIKFYKEKGIDFIVTETIKKKEKTKILWLKGSFDISKIDYDYLIIESPNSNIKIDKKNIDKPVLLLLDKEKQKLNNGFSIIETFPNLQLIVGDILSLEINNHIVKIIEDFVRGKKISKKYKFTQKGRTLRIKDLKQKKKVEIFNKNWYISKECNSLCKLSFLTYPKHIYSLLYPITIKEDSLSKPIRNIFILLKQNKNLKALLLSIELKSIYKDRVDFNSFINFITKKVLKNEKYLKIPLK